MLLYGLSKISLCIIIMAVTRCLANESESGSGAGSQDRLTLIEDHVREIIREEVIRIFRDQISDVFGSNKTAIVEYFDKCYVAIAETVVATTSTAVTRT